jgi:hypothetical protein
MLDTARNLYVQSDAHYQVLNSQDSFPISDIKRTLDVMSWVKVCHTTLAIL